MDRSTTKPDPKSEVLAMFSRHINELCDDWGMPQHGRQTHLGAKFGVNPNTARKWLLGIGLPELEKSIEIANEAGVNIRWLLQGEGLKKGDKVDADAEMLKSAIEELPDHMRQASFDFIEYQLVKADGFIAPGKLSSYIKLLEHLKSLPKER